MIKPSTKIKRGTELLLNGQSVWVNLDQGGDNVFVCYQKTQDVLKGDEFEWVVRSDLKPVSKSRQSLTTKPKPATSKEKSEKQLLNDFFDEMAEKMPYNCESCGRPLYANTKWWKRCCTAHILAKADFPTVATNPDNILFLGTSLLGICTCHNTFDQSIDKRSQMPVYHLAVERYQKLKQCLTAAEIIKADKYLGLS